MVTVRSKLLIVLAALGVFYVAFEYIGLAQAPWAEALPGDWGSVLFVVAALVVSAIISVVVDRRSGLSP